MIVVFLSAILIQLIYLVVFIIAFLKKRNNEMSTVPVPVSVIVCAHDEEQNLRTLIPQLLGQEHPEFEVIVVNDRSNDDTYDFLLEESKKDERLKVVNVDRVPEHINGKKYAITLGIKAARHEWILLTDADCRPATTRWISAMSARFYDRAVFALGFSPYLKKPGLLNLFIRFESLVTAVQYLAFALLKNPYMGVGRNLAYRKSLFLEKKGFNNFLHVTGGDDDLFVNRHAHGGNTTVQIDPEATVFSIPETSWRSFYWQKVRHLAVGKRYKLKHRLLLGLFALTWVITWGVGIPLIMIHYTNPLIIGAFLLRLLMLIVTLNVVSNKTRQPFELWAIPALDFLYPIYYISTGLIALTTRKIRWRN